MPLFTQVAKFAGFAGKAAEEAEVASFFKGLGISTEGSAFAEKVQGSASKITAAEREGFSFEHVTEGEKRLTYLRKGEERVGYVSFDVSNPASPRVAGSQIYKKELKRQGLGAMMYKAGFSDVFETITEAQKVTSDLAFGASEEAQRVWQNIPGVQSVQGGQGYEIQRAAMKKLADQTAQDMLMAGAGNDNTSLLNRGLKSVRGSHKTSAAL